MGKRHSIAVVGGDGTGPEVVAEGLKVLKAAEKRYGVSCELAHYDFNGTRYLATGKTLTDEDLAALRKHDAIYLGAIGHPKVKPGVLEQGILLRLRFELDQYINLRPVKLYPGIETPLAGKKPEDIDFVVVRENTESLYIGSGGFLRKGTPNEVAIQEMIATRFGVERCIRYAFETTHARRRTRKVKLDAGDVTKVSSEKPGPVEFVHRERGKMKGKLVEKSADGYTFEVAGMLTLCAKTNVLTFASDLWWRTFNEVGAADYPEIYRDYAHVDATCMWMVKNPEWFDVIVTDNMFGDIITDLGAIIQGGMGVAAGGNINPKGVSMFEPIGGSAPKYTGKNVINPMAAIGACQMMLDFLGEREAAAAVERAMMATFLKMKSQAAGRMGMSTTEVGDTVAASL